MSADNPSLRLRQAISLNDLTLTQRILESNPSLLYNPCDSDKANTSLHLAASLGSVDIARHLIKLGHDSIRFSDNEVCVDASTRHGISVNVDGQTALHLASANLHTPVVQLLCEEFPTTINRKDKQGQIPLLLAAAAQTKFVANSTPQSRPTVRNAEDISTIETLLLYGSDVLSKDVRGNTCLHNACAFGNLKAIRAFMEAGADPSCMNFEGWKPEMYSITVQAEVYYKNLVAEFERRYGSEQRLISERKGKGGGAVRLVSEEEDDDESESAESQTGRSRADSGRSQSTFESAMS